ncbi:hypothetical protein CCR91_09835 [Thiorhodovibrio winogradskyi]|nr:hypothetical protein [Thiorhodovibrio winogradskyi]
MTATATAVLAVSRTRATELSATTTAGTTLAPNSSITATAAATYAGIAARALEAATASTTSFGDNCSAIAPGAANRGRVRDGDPAQPCIGTVVNEHRGTGAKTATATPACVRPIHSAVAPSSTGGPDIGDGEVGDLGGAAGDDEGAVGIVTIKGVPIAVEREVAADHRQDVVQLDVGSKLDGAVVKRRAKHSTVADVEDGVAQAGLCTDLEHAARGGAAVAVGGIKRPVARRGPERAGANRDRDGEREWVAAEGVCLGHDCSPLVLDKFKVVCDSAQPSSHGTRSQRRYLAGVASGIGFVRL